MLLHHHETAHYGKICMHPRKDTYLQMLRREDSLTFNLFAASFMLKWKSCIRSSRLTYSESDMVLFPVSLYCRSCVLS